ncbi:MAG: porphobilinogen synthase [Peptococcaceae bacterium]|nr:porphobilinogen synthase [Peptococcaceae bacterium]
MFPQTRMRRYRNSENLRSMVRESRLHVEQLIYPLFVIEGEQIKNPIDSMPGVYQFSLDNVLAEVERAVQAGIKSLLLFGIPAAKDAVGTGAYAEDGIVQKALRLIRENYPDLVLIADCCLCEYTDHGHCGVLVDDYVENDPTLNLLAKTAVSQARAGADIIAPSDMMDGRVGAIRRALDENGFKNVAVMSYAAKYASSFYGPFRDAAGSAPQFGDRKTYQMDPACSVRQAMAETELDVMEGADYIIVKPALAYMDIITKTRASFYQPVVAYNVSGEYSMVKAAAMQGWIDEKKIVMEIMTGFIRSGSDLIITYHAVDVANWLKEQ